MANNWINDAYNDVLAAYLARVSQSAYKKANIDVNGTQALIISEHDHAVIAFRGTEQNYTDILTDVRTYFDGITHAGFLEAYLHAHPQIDKVMQIIGNKPVFITGHSLGGALAAVASWVLCQDYNIMACYTYGSPRVGRQEMDEESTCPVYRIVNDDDIVPRLPLLLMGYHHVGDLKHLTEEGDMVRSPSSLTTGPKFLSTLATRTCKVFEDHRISEYVRKLDEEKTKNRKRHSEGQHHQAASEKR